MKRLFILVALLCIAGCPQRSMDYCALPGVQCRPCGDGGCEGLEPITWCCPPYVSAANPCEAVAGANDCTWLDTVLLCEWGQTLEDGSVACFD